MTRQNHLHPLTEDTQFQALLLNQRFQGNFATVPSPIHNPRQVDIFEKLYKTLSSLQRDQMILRITQYGEPILRKVGKTVTQFDDTLAELADNMIETMHDADGIGLAAQQVGLALQFFVIDVRPPESANAGFDYRLDGKKPPLDLIMPMALANPKVSIIDPQENTCEEGCLSFPEVRGKLDRPIGVLCKYQDVKRNPHTIEANGILGRCILHEVDHLNGELFIDKMDRRDLLQMQSRIKKIKRASRDFLKAQK